MQVGDRHEIDGVPHEVVSVGTLSEEGVLDVEEGRVPVEGDEGMLIAPEDDPDRVFWLQPSSVVEQRGRVAALEVEMDALMPRVRRELLAFEEDGVVPFAVAASLMRAAAVCAYGYALDEEPRGALAIRAGYIVEEPTG